MRSRGLALIVVVGVLGVLAVLAAAFVAMAQLERRASEQRVNAAKAYLLARSGIEDALARLVAGQDPNYGGENWDGSADGLLSGYEAGQEVHHRTGAGTPADVEACPVRHALRPSFFVRAVGNPAVLTVDGRQRGYSGLLAGDQAPQGNAYALKVQAANAGILVNGGDLGARSRDASMEGPNGFLVRLLNNLDAILTNGATSNLGIQIVGARPLGGYKSLDELPARARAFRPFLTPSARVDPKVVKPQPVDGRPHRWEDIDDSHRLGTPAMEIAGVKAAGGGNLQLDTWVSGLGTETSPWSQAITATNGYEGIKTYPVRWEKDFVYAWSQLRPAPPAFEPRAPLSLHGAPREVLAAAFRSLKGTFLEVWDGSGGWDNGWAWNSAQSAYPYPDQATEDTPWHRTRVDYGMTYGSDERPWYGPGNYDPHASPREKGGKPVVQSAPIGRLKETEPVSQAQALALADRIVLQRGRGSLRTWARFNAFLESLPRWEDLNDDGILDGPPYPVTGSGGVYPRRTYRREDLDSNGLMTREVFVPAQLPALGAWKDPGKRKGELPEEEAPGLTFLQKDVLRAMANPNTDLNDFNPDANLFKEVDKTDLLDHTTELALDDAAGHARLACVGRVTGPRGRLLAQRRAGALVKLGDVHRDTTQADFLEGTLELPSPPAYGLSGEQALVGYPEPPGEDAADYDGQLGLGFIAPAPGPYEKLRGDLFGTADAAQSGNPAVPDLRGPFKKPLLASGEDAGGIFPDGAYSEKDRALKYGLKGMAASAALDAVDGQLLASIFPIINIPFPNIPNPDYWAFYGACWVKPHWLPEASPRPRCLISLSRGMGKYGGGSTPMRDIRIRPLGLYFVPARNNLMTGTMASPYQDNDAVARGLGWPCRALLFGTVDTLYASDTLNRRGIEAPPLTHPLGRLEGRRWQHVAAISLQEATSVGTHGATTVLLGRKPASSGNGGGYNGPIPADNQAIGETHEDGTANHLRFGEVAGAHNMNYMADATFACVRAGLRRIWVASTDPLNSYVLYFSGSSGPAALGRYLKEGGAAYASPGLPEGLRPVRITWTEVPCDLWFDRDGDGWLGDAAGLYRPENDRFGSSLSGIPLPNGKRDVRIDLEVWDDMGRLARFEDPAGDNRIPPPRGRLRYKAVFVNEWDEATRQNHPLDVTPFLDDVTIVCREPGGARVLAWTDDED